MNNETDKVVNGLWKKFESIIGDELSESAIKLVQGLMHVMSPFNYEYYLSAFELVDSNGRTVMYFQFPLNPQSITVSEQRGHDIQRTFSSVVVTDSDTFVPTIIDISGNFGRELKVMALNKSGRTEIGTAAAMISEEFTTDAIHNTYRARKWSKMIGANTLVMTGYGAIKMMQIITSCDTLLGKDNQPFKLIFHNYSAGDSMWVKVKNLQIKQSLDSNMIWNYTCNMDAIAPAEYVCGIFSKKKALKMMAIGVANRTISDVAKKVAVAIAPSTTDIKKVMASKAIKKSERQVEQALKVIAIAGSKKG